MEDDSYGTEGEWMDTLLPQQVLPVSDVSSASGAFCSASDVVAAAASAVAACMDDEVDENLLQPLAEAYLLAVRNEARLLPKVVCASGNSQHAPLSRRDVSGGKGEVANDCQCSAELRQKAVPYSADEAGTICALGDGSASSGHGMWLETRSINGHPHDEAKSPSRSMSFTTGSAVHEGLPNFVAEVDKFAGAPAQARYSAAPTGSSGQCSLTLSGRQGMADNTDMRFMPATQMYGTDSSASADDSEDIDTQEMSYLQKILIMEKKRSAAESSEMAPSLEWSKDSLSAFVALRESLSQEAAPAVQRGVPQAKNGNCQSWDETEWRLYCRCYPPSVEMLARCDNVTLCRVLSLLADDIVLQRRAITRTHVNGRTSENDTAPMRLQRSKCHGQAGCPCCSVEACHLTLQQASWLFGIFLFLDELQAMDADVAFCIQSVRRECESARRRLARNFQARRKADMIGAAAGVAEERKIDSVAREVRGGSAVERSEGSLLAALNLLILVTGDFFKQK
ncbi:hypothetical protein BESB_066070 [Besnoitia besnoiti]|uniref:Uncharacterized protein n=1 Tax=Besnoitia besnoiti TaxID=94643 RepID=A0A2A9MBH9_BESBE|nr:hypothetical protein BESB_066070 [Besnoitia besnoiti]PFH34574.1 hypothetical protein BESB_066070 [Besnoitia besnoiti]